MTLPLSINLMPKSPASDLADLAVLAERLGYRRCWVYDEGLVTRDLYVTLAAVALATDRILLGPGITNPYVRHPGVTAAAVATIDELSDGRAFVGIGTGGGLTLGPLGIDRRKPVATVGQMVSSLRGLFAGETVDTDGEVFSLRSASLAYGRPDIEVILAGRGPKILSLGGEVADGFNLSYIHKDLIGEHVSVLRSATRQKDRRFTITYSTMLVTSEEEFQKARSTLSFRLVDSPTAVRRLIGMTEEEVVGIREALAEGGTTVAADLVREEWVSQFTIVGSPREAGAELRNLLTRQGVDEFQLPVQEVQGAAALIERTADMVATG